MSKCWYCNNELTTGDNPKHFGICNKCYDEMFKSSDTIIRSFTNKIADLEAKLAEKEHSIGMLNQYLTDKAIQIERLGEELAELKTENMNIFEYSKEVEQQLAEKEKENAELHTAINMSIPNQIAMRGEIERLHTCEDMYPQLPTIVIGDRDKILFAIEQLEKLKVELHTIYTSGYLKLIDEEIDDQIQELKRRMT